MPTTERLKEALATAEATAGEIEIDEIAFVIGSFPQGHWLREQVNACPRIKELLPEMEPCGSETKALLFVANYMHRDDIVGVVSDLIRKAVRH
jgi:hypothetical protein